MNVFPLCKNSHKGKTHLAIALGMLAVDAGKSVRFLPCAQLVFDLKAAKERGRLDERYQELSKVDLLILDEFGKWGTVLADDKLAAALVDRIVHHGRLVEFRGESRRVADSLMLGNRKEG